MEQNPLNYLSINDVLADVQVILQDEDNHMLTPGFYKAQVKLALNELGFDYPFVEAAPVDVELPDDLIVTMPAGCYNLKQLFVFTGTPDSITYSERVYWKKGMHTQGKNTGYTADTKPYLFNDPFCSVDAADYSIYFFTIHNGTIYLSDSCQNYDYVRMIFDGIPSRNLSEVRMVPPEVRKAVVDWVTVRCAGALKMKDARYRVIQMDAERSLDEYGLNGSWHEAQQRIVRLDKKMLKDVIEYNSKLGE